MSRSESILVVEIKTVNEAEFNPNQVQLMTVFNDSASNYHSCTSIKQIEQAIFEAIPHLGTNFRHPLFFNVQILPGDQTDALIASIQGRKLRGRRFRQTGKN